MNATLATRPVAVADLTAIGVAVRAVVTEPAALDQARGILEAELAALDLACSRFRPDAELAAVNASAGRTLAISELLAEAVGVALAAARSTGGLVDPTLGSSLVRLGYDRDFEQLPADGPRVPVSIWRGAHWDQVRLDRAARTLRLPAGVQLDLGATAKAWCADRIAERIHRELETGVLVSLGGDIAVAGQAPDGGWPIQVQDRPGADDPSDAPRCTVSIASGGLATSSTAARRWRRGGEPMHHLIDPSNGMPARSPWRTVTVAATTCLEANVATTAAMVSGAAGLARLEAAGLPARLVRNDGTVVMTGGWPAQESP
jgi:thiamine biosynthesis lipoprotein